jgi:phenylacetic acid degradation operon negative regulatory protein
VPRSLLMTFFGAFLRQLGGWIAVADLIALMAELDLDAQSVRSSVSRLKRRGVIASERRGRAAGYRLTEHGEAILRAGDARIFGRTLGAGSGRDLGRSPGAGSAPDLGRSPGADSARVLGWVLVVFSVPEAQRALRHRLRTGLAGLGLGTVAPAVWIAPAPLADEVRLLVSELGLTDRVDLFAADPLTADPARWWDLDAIAAEYRRYLDAWEPQLAAPGGFAEHIRHLDAWRRIPFHDPGLPTDALPPDWPGEHAWAVFAELDRQLSPAALTHVRATLKRDSPPTPRLPPAALRPSARPLRPSG